MSGSSRSLRPGRQQTLGESQEGIAGHCKRHRRDRPDDRRRAEVAIEAVEDELAQSPVVLQQYDTPAKILAEPATAFVAEFLSPDRGQKRLSVVNIDPHRLEKAALIRTHAEVPVTATLADALSAMLLHDSDRVRVNSNGEVLGVLTLNALLETAGVHGGGAD